MNGRLKLLFACAVSAAAAVVWAKDLELVRDGKAASVIVLRDDAGPVEKHAAAELSKYLEKLSGAKVEIKNAPSKELVNIRLGTTDSNALELTDKMKAEAAKIGAQGFMLAADQNGLRIVGKQPLGVLYGSYEVLKKYGDVRWFAPGSDFEHCPKKATVAVPEQTTVGNPSFPVRQLSFVFSNYTSNLSDTWDWMVRNGMTMTLTRHLTNNTPLRAEAQKRGALVGRDGGHCFVNLLPDTLFEEHPEYFGLFNGKRVKQDIGDGMGARRQPCTSNPKVVEIMAENLKKVFETEPRGRGMYLIGNNDADAWCQCENCVKLDPPEERSAKCVSTRYWTLVNKLAAEVLKVHPEASLIAWAYQGYQTPPVGITPDPRVAIEIAIHGSCHRHSLNDPACSANEKFRVLISGFAKLKNQTQILEYPDCISRYCPIEKPFASDIKYFSSLGVGGRRTYTVPPDGVFGKGAITHQQKQCGFDEAAALADLREMWPSFWQAYYVNAQLLWDAGADYDKICEDMGSKYYGAAWPAMKKYRATLEKAFLETQGHMCYGTPDFLLGKCLEKPGVGKALDDALAEAARLAGDDKAVQKRVALDKDLLGKYWKRLHAEYLAKLQKEVNAGRAAAPVAVDGNADKAEWKAAEFVSDFTLTDGKTPAEPKTFVKMLYDDKNLYFLVEAMEPETAKMKVLAKERDGNVWSDNSVEFFIASPGMDAMIDTRGRYAHIVVNSNGVIYDALSIGGGNSDSAYDSKAKIKTTVLKDRWVLEMSVPAEALFSEIKSGESWKINVARNRRLAEGPGQASSWSGGVFHGRDAFRSVVLGGEALLKNGNFEDAVEPNKHQKKSNWQFAGNKVSTYWAFHEGSSGIATIMEESGGHFLRIKDGWIHQRLNQPADYRHSLRARAKIRGRGEVNIAMYHYERESGKNLPTKELRRVPVDSSEWTTVETLYECGTDNVLRLAFQVKGEVDFDDVTVTQAPNPDAAEQKK